VRDGLVYRLPKRRIKVTLTVDADAAKPPTVSVETTEPYPDLDTRFTASFRRNQVGTNDLNLVVSDKGLLGSATSETTSKLSEVLQGLAGVVGTLKPAAIAARTGSKDALAECKTPAVYTYIFEPAITRESPSVKNTGFCGLTITTTLLGGAALGTSTPRLEKAFTQSQSGLFYRQPLPYSVEVTVANQQFPFVVMLPNGIDTDGGPIQFLPVARSLFGHNKATLTFADGVPTGYQESVDGEAIGLVALPAQVVGAYFEAIGKMFTARKGVKDTETSYDAAVVTLAVQQQKTKKCLQAVSGGDSDAIKAACE